jgi:3-oxoacyl-[acyl-carrier protein] reductase
MQIIQGKTAIVTGGAAGIGAGIITRFAQEGARQIAIVDIDLSGAERLAETVHKQFGCECVPVRASIDSEADVTACFEIIAARFDRLDILVNNAGVGGVIDMDDLTPARWDRTFGINVRGSFLMAREAIRLMKPHRSGRIVNMASQAGKIGGLMIGMDYSCSKGAVLTLTKSLARVCAPHGITVNSVAPGLIATGMTDTFGYDPGTVPLGRIGTPEEVADVVLFAASDLSRYITGACFDVNGGMSMW